MAPIKKRRPKYANKYYMLDPDEDIFTGYISKRVHEKLYRLSKTVELLR